MRARLGTRLSLVLGLVLAAAVPVAGGTVAGTQDGTCPGDLGPGTADGPGERLADAIGDQRSAIRNELDDRRFDARLAEATTPEARAAVVATEVERIGSRLDALEACRADLVDARATGTMTDESFEGHADGLLVAVEALRHRFNETAAATATLPGELRDEYDVDAERLAGLETRLLDLHESVDRALADAGETD